MKLVHYDDNANFGDVLNVPLSRRIFGDIFDDDQTVRFLFIGTMIARSSPPGTREIILGAGAGYKKGPYTLDSREIFCVRGPLTCQLLGLEPKYAAIDPAILCSRYYNSDRAADEESGTIFIPHYSTDLTAGAVYRASCEELGITYLSPLEPVETILGTIARARRVITEALHGAIAAESYNVPWVPVICANYVMALKWRDFCETIGVAYHPHEIHLNVAFDGRPRLVNRLKHAAYQVGLGKPRYKYLPLHAARGDEARRIADMMRPIVERDAFMIGDPAAKKLSIERLDAAIERFRRAYPET